VVVDSTVLWKRRRRRRRRRRRSRCHLSGSSHDQDMTHMNPPPQGLHTHISSSSRLAYVPVCQDQAMTEPWTLTEISIQA
jgi:hypothetical protein